MIKQAAGIGIVGLMLGAASCSQAGKVPAALQPMQGTWRIITASNTKGMFLPWVGTDAAITGNTMVLPSAAGGSGGVELTLKLRAAEGGIWDISIAPVKGPPGWAMRGIAKLEGGIWTLHVAPVGDKDSNLTDFLPRDDASDVVVLRKE